MSVANGSKLNNEFKLVDIEPGLRGYLGLTEDGKIVQWGSNTEGKLTLVPGATGVVQLAEGYWLKSDGTVWTVEGQVKERSNIVRIASSHNILLTIDRDGALRLGGWKEPLGHITDWSSITMAAVSWDGSNPSAAILDKNGEVTLYDPFSFDDNLKVKPKLIASGIKSIVYSGRNLILLNNDGTLSKISYFDPIEPLEGIVGAEKLVSPYYYRSEYNADYYFFLKLKSGQWKIVSSRGSADVELPHISKVEFSVDTDHIRVGGKTKATIYFYPSNGSKEQLPLSQADIRIEKPHLFKANADGTLQATGVGQSQVTVMVEGISQTVTLTASLDTPLDGAKQISGVTYLPLKSVFEALGGKIAYNAASKAFQIKVGKDTIVLTTGKASAQVNGKTITMNGAVRVEDSQTVFPAALLSKALGAKLKWDASWHTMEVSMGNGSLLVYSDKTYRLIKRKEQGDLYNWIGKTFWANHFEDRERFSKLTITDIQPNYRGLFQIIFKTGGGYTVVSDQYSESYITSMLKSSYYFLNYDPYKTYNWSSSTWATIRAEKISIGMTKEQVRLSWGDPYTTSVATSSRITIETWGYRDFTYVTFTNGRVSSIYT